MVVDANARVEDMSIALRYQGPTVQSGSMAEVRAFQPGSFATDLLFHVSGAAATIWAAHPDMGGLLLTIKESLGLFRFLRGEAPKNAATIDNSLVSVTNVNGDVQVVRINSLHVTLSDIGGQSVEKFLNKALEKPGIESVDITSDLIEVARISHNDAQFFRPIDLPPSAIPSLSSKVLG